MSADPPLPKPLITIAMTCFNAADTIGRAIDSALGQDWDNTEIIIIDDCSTDHSIEIVRSYEDRGVTLIQHAENIGPGGARSTLMDNANGDFVAFFDDDDESFPERLRAQYERIIAFETEYPNMLCACYASGERHYDSGYSIDIIAPGRENHAAPHGEKMAAHLLYFETPPDDWQLGGTPSCGLMVRRQTARNIGGFDDHFRRVEDLDFAVRLALSGGYFIGTKNKLFKQYATSAADKAPEKNLVAEQQLVQKHAAFLKARGVYFYAMNWPKLRYFHFTKNYLGFAVTLIQLLITNPLRAIKHLLKTGPKRLAHEAKMKAKKTDKKEEAT